MALGGRLPPTPHQARSPPGARPHGELEEPPQARPGFSQPGAISNPMGGGRSVSQFNPPLPIRLHPVLHLPGAPRAPMLRPLALERLGPRDHVGVPAAVVGVHAVAPLVRAAGGVVVAERALAGSAASLAVKAGLARVAGGAPPVLEAVQAGLQEVVDDGRGCGVGWRSCRTGWRRVHSGSSVRHLRECRHGRRWRCRCRACWIDRGILGGRLLE